MLRHGLTVAAIVAVLLGAGPVAASTLPRPDFGNKPILGLGLGYGLGVSYDVPISKNLLAGLGGHLTGMGFGLFAGTMVEARALYRFYESGPLQVVATGGVSLTTFNFGNVAWAQAIQTGPVFSPFVGVLAAYRLTMISPLLTARVGVTSAPFSGLAIGLGGAELGYQFSPKMEATVGLAGGGEYLGLKTTF